jgi:hypothetical protein
MSILPARRQLKNLLLSVLALLCCAGLAREGFAGRQRHRADLRSRDVPITTARAGPLIAAIDRYRERNGRPPADLQALVPSYIPRIPDPGPLAIDGWHYRPGNDEGSGGWALWVFVREEYSPNVWGFGDALVYHPSGQYPRAAYRGIRAWVDEWAYYVE